MIEGCGRYEFKRGTSDKFWQIQPHPNGGYIAEWGRNGRSPQDSKIYSEIEAQKKIHEKRGKGYELVAHLDVKETNFVKAVKKGLGKQSLSDFVEQAESITTHVRKADKAKVELWEDSLNKLNQISDHLTKRHHLRLVKSEVTDTGSALENAGVLFPATCEKNYLPDDLEQPHLIAEQKLDGSRYVLYFGHDPYGRQPAYGIAASGNTLLSRHPSRIIGDDQGKLVDRTFELAHVTKQKYPNLIGTVIDGECMDGFKTYNAFDIMFFCGTDVRALPLKERRVMLEKVIKMMGNEFVTAIPQVTKNIKEYFHKIVDAGGEGLVVKDLTKPYGSCWFKYKKSYDVSVVITGKKEGTEEGTVGSVAVSVYQKGKLIEIGYAAGFDKKTKIAMAKNFNKFIGRTIDVFCQEMTKSTTGLGRLRHCTFHKFRDEVDPKDCTVEKLKKDLKTGVRKDRSK